MVSKQLNPVIIAGYDVIYLGRKGFASIARANRALIRPKGSPKGTPWTEISFGKLRKKSAKEDLVTKALFKLTKRKDTEAEQQIKREKKVAEKVPSKVKFKETNVTSKLIKTMSGRHIDIRKHYFETDKAYQFVQAKDLNIFAVRNFVQSVRNEFMEKIYRQYGESEYFIRIYHDYQGLISNAENDPMDKGFTGLAVTRQEMNKEDAKEQFEIMEETYLESFSNYLRFARADTFFRFTGFTVEVTVDERSMDEFRVSKLTKKKRAKKKAKNKKKPKKKKSKKRK